MKLSIVAQEKVRLKCKKYKKENVQLKQKLKVFKRILIDVSNLIQQISPAQSFAHSRRNHIDRRKVTRNRLTHKRLDRQYPRQHPRHNFQIDYHWRQRAHRARRLSSSLLQPHGSPSVSFKSFVPSDISTIRTMNSSFVVGNLSNENEVCVGAEVLVGWSTPGHSDDESEYFTPESQSETNESNVQKATGYDGDAEMSSIMMHGNNGINEPSIHNANLRASSELHALAQSISESGDLSLQSECYNSQQSSDVFSDFGEILNDTNNNDESQDLRKYFVPFFWPFYRLIGNPIHLLKKNVNHCLWQIWQRCRSKIPFWIHQLTRMVRPHPRIWVLYATQLDGNRRISACNLMNGRSNGIWKCISQTMVSRFHSFLR